MSLVDKTYVYVYVKVEVLKQMLRWSDKFYFIIDDLFF